MRGAGVATVLSSFQYAPMIEGQCFVRCALKAGTSHGEAHSGCCAQSWHVKRCSTHPFKLQPFQALVHYAAAASCLAVLPHPLIALWQGAGQRAVSGQHTRAEHGGQGLRRRPAHPSSLRSPHLFRAQLTPWLAPFFIADTAPGWLLRSGTERLCEDAVAARATHRRPPTGLPAAQTHPGRQHRYTPAHWGGWRLAGCERCAQVCLAESRR